MVVLRSGQFCQVPLHCYSGASIARVIKALWYVITFEGSCLQLITAAYIESCPLHAHFVNGVDLLHCDIFEPCKEVSFATINVIFFSFSP